MEGLRKKTIYLEKLEDIEKKIKSLTTNMTAGGLRFFLLHLLYEIQRTHEFFSDVEALVVEKKYTTDILEIDADVDYTKWSENEHWKMNVDVQSLQEDKELEPIEKTIWGMLDTLPPNDSDQYVDFSRTDYKLVLQQILWSKCSNKQLYYALTQSIQNLRATLLRIGDKQSKRELSLADGEKLYKGEELRFNFSEAAKVVADFKKWKSDHDDDEETIKKYIEGKKLSELSSFFKSGFLSSKLTLQNEIDFSNYQGEIDFERLRRICENIDVEAHYSAMRELFKINKGVLIPQPDKIGRYLFKHRKEVTAEHRAALFRFIKMLWLIEEEKKQKKKVPIKEINKVNPLPDTKSSFYCIVQHEDPEKLVERLHQLIDKRSGADVGCVFLKCLQDGYITRKPTKKEFVSEFSLIGGWKAIHNYMSDNNENALDRANKIIVF